LPVPILERLISVIGQWPFQQAQVGSLVVSGAALHDERFRKKTHAGVAIFLRHSRAWARVRNRRVLT
jgi:hypothetical protein